MARKKAEAPPTATPVGATSDEAAKKPAAETRNGTDGTKPVKTFRLGRLWANVWEHQHPETGTWYAVSITRSYRDKAEKWQSSTNFGKDDLLAVAELARMAFHWINETLQREFELSEG